MLIKSRANADVCRHQGIEFDPSESLRREFLEKTAYPEQQFSNAPHLHRIAAPVLASTMSVLPTVPLRLLTSRGLLGRRARMCSAVLQRPSELFRHDVQDAEVLVLVAGRLNALLLPVVGIRRASVYRVGRGHLYLHPVCVLLYQSIVLVRERTCATETGLHGMLGRLPLLLLSLQRVAYFDLAA